MAKLLERIFEHGRNNPTQKWRRQLQTRVGISLNEPHFEILINEEIKPKNLETELFFSRVDFGVDWLYGISSEFLHLRVGLLPEFKFVPSLHTIECRVQVSLKVGEWEFVAGFVFAIILAFFLDGIICEVDHTIGQIFHVKLLASCSDVAVLVPIAFLYSIDTRNENITADVKFPFLVQKWHNVLLDNMSARSSLAICAISAYYLLDLLQTFHHFDAIATICILTRFN